MLHDCKEVQHLWQDSWYEILSITVFLIPPRVMCNSYDDHVCAHECKLYDGVDILVHQWILLSDTNISSTHMCACICIYIIMSQHD